MDGMRTHLPHEHTFLNRARQRTAVENDLLDIQVRPFPPCLPSLPPSTPPSIPPQFSPLPPSLLPSLPFSYRTSCVSSKIYSKAACGVSTSRWPFMLLSTLWW